MTDISIMDAHQGSALEDARALVLEYADTRGFPLTWQGFDDELAGLPGQYAPPRGRLLVARLDGEASGCVALRPADGDACEMKRLYVRDAARGHGLGRLLCERVIAEARAIGYREMLLDTLERMAEANRLYAALGFVQTEAYRYNPLPDVRYLRLDL
jgi:GNAT superfamily N-acetyltransferase